MIEEILTLERTLTIIKIILIAIVIISFLALLYWIYHIRTNMGVDNDNNNPVIIDIETEIEADIDEYEDVEFEPIDGGLTFAPIEETETEAVEVIEHPKIAQCEYTYYDENDLMLLARIVENESGSNWCTDEHQKAVASVVMNRVNDPRFPDSIYGVISQGWNGECPIQYAVGSAERFFGIVPSERAIQNAAYVLENCSTVPEAVWQAQFVQGEILAVFETDYSTTYICK